MKQGEEEEAQSKSNGGKKSKGKGGTKSKGKTQAEEVLASSEGEMRGVGRTRPAGKAKGKATEERVNMTAEQEELEVKEDSKSRT